MRCCHVSPVCGPERGSVPAACALPPWLPWLLDSAALEPPQLLSWRTVTAAAGHGAWCPQELVSDGATVALIRHWSREASAELCSYTYTCTLLKLWRQVAVCDTGTLFEQMSTCNVKVIQPCHTMYMHSALQPTSRLLGQVALA